MKKFLFLLTAYMAMFLTAVTNVSCSDDDDEEKVSLYTITAELTSNTLPQQTIDAFNAKMAETIAGNSTQKCTESVARVAFNATIASMRSSMQYALNELATECGTDDFALVFKLLDSNGKVIAQETFTPQSYSEDDDDNSNKVSLYTITAELTSNTLPRETIDAFNAKMAEKIAGNNTQKCTESVARAAFNATITSMRSSMQYALNELATECGTDDFALVFKLLDSNGKVIAQETFTPQSY